MSFFIASEDTNFTPYSKYQQSGFADEHFFAQKNESTPDTSVSNKKQNAIYFFNDLILNELNSRKIKCWIAGGAIRDYFTDAEMTSDFDIFFPNKTNFEKAKKYLLDNGGKIVWESENGMKIIYKKNKFDLVKKFYPTPEATISNFDYTVSMCAIGNNTLFMGQKTEEDLINKKLTINRISSPLSSLKRALNHTKKDFKMPASEVEVLYQKICSLPANQPVLNFSSSGENIDDYHESNESKQPIVGDKSIAKQSSINYFPYILIAAVVAIAIASKDK